MNATIRWSLVAAAAAVMACGPGPEVSDVATTEQAVLTTNVAATGPLVLSPGGPHYDGVITDLSSLIVELFFRGENRIVLVEGSIDVGTLRNLPVPRGVTLVGARGGVNEGPLIFTNDLVEGPMFDLTNDDVTLRGLRLRGPTDSTDESAPDVIGVHVGSSQRVTIEDCEIFDFPRAGISVSDEHGRIDPLYTATRIRGNFLHHNQKHGLGYGVVVGHGAYAFIERNLFNHHRHGITSDGREETGYFAYSNFFLPETHGYYGGFYYGQHLDVHGRNDPGTWKGGLAGELFDIAFNTIRGDQRSWPGPQRNAFKLRGEPSNAARFHENVTEHSQDDAVSVDCGSYACRPNLQVWSNTYDTDTSFLLGAGDFDGDHRGDVFQATGAAWFYSAGGVAEWRYLSLPPASIRALTAAELGFADIDNDGKTDVLARLPDGSLQYSSGGTGSLQPLTTSPVRASDLRYGDFDGDHRTDIFRTDGATWSLWRGSTRTWAVVQHSGLALSELRFGDFDGNGTTDVLGNVNGGWSLSRGATTSWARWGSNSGSVSGTVAGDFNGDGHTDLAWQSGTTWYLSASAAVAPVAKVSNVDPDDTLRYWLVGDFDGDRAADVLTYQHHREAYPSSPSTHLVFDQNFVVSRRLAAPVVSSRYEMR